MEQGGRLAAKAKVTDEILDKCKPIAGTPADCIAAIEEYRDAGCTHVMLELWGDRRHEQIELFGKEVLPHFRLGRPALTDATRSRPHGSGRCDRRSTSAVSRSHAAQPPVSFYAVAGRGARVRPT